MSVAGEGPWILLIGGNADWGGSAAHEWSRLFPSDSNFRLSLEWVQNWEPIAQSQIHPHMDRGGSTELTLTNQREDVGSLEKRDSILQLLPKADDSVPRPHSV